MIEKSPKNKQQQQQQVKQTAVIINTNNQKAPIKKGSELRQSNASQKQEQNVQNNVEQNNSPKEPSFLTNQHFNLTQVLDLVLSAVPNLWGIYGIFFLLSTSMAFLAQLGDNTLMAGYGLGLTCLAATLLAVITGLNSGMGQQQSHAFGAQQFSQVGILLQRGILVLLFYIILIIPLLINLSKVLTFFNIEKSVADIAQNVVIGLLPSQISLVAWDGIRQFMMSQYEFSIPMYAQNIIYMFTPVLCYVFTQVLQWKEMGLVTSRNIMDFLIFIILLIQIKKNPKFQKTSIPFKKQAFSDWWNYLQISIPIGAIVYLEWVFLEIMTIEVGALRDQESLAAHVALQSVYLIFYGTGLALSWCISSYLGNLMGAGKKEIAKKFIYRAIGSGFVVSVSFCLLGNIIKPLFVRLITTDAQMATNFSGIYSLYINMVFYGDLFQALLGAILKACGLQKFAAIVFALVYYGIGIPLSYGLIFTFQFGMPGAWITLFIVSAITCIIFFIRIKTLDFEKCIEIVQNNIQSYKQLEEEEEPEK